MGIEEAGLGVYKGDVGVGEKGFDAGAQLCQHLVLAGYDLTEVEVVVQPTESELFAFFQHLHQLGSVGKGLGGYAAFIQAGTAHVGTFYDHYLQPACGGMPGSPIAAGTCTDNNYVCISHLFSIVYRLLRDAWRPTRRRRDRWGSCAAHSSPRRGLSWLPRLSGASRQ